MKKKLLIDFIFLFLLGGITSLSLPPFNYFIINFFTFTALFLFLLEKSKIHFRNKIFFFYGWFFGFGFFLSNLYWVSISLSFDQNFKQLIPLTVILLPALISLFYGFITYLFIIFNQKKIISSFLIFSVLFGSFEYIRGIIFTGFPWNLIAYSFSNQTEILSVISLIGTYGFNLLCISLFTSPAILLKRKSKKDILISFLILISPIIFFIYGLNYKEKFNMAKKVSYDYKIRVIGSNISLNRFYDSPNPKKIIGELIDISVPNKDESIIFLWPEGILPDVSQNELIKYSYLFDNYFNENHILAMGINSFSIFDGIKNYYNSFSVYDNKLNLLGSYNKINLVPFGEFLPFESLLSYIGLKSITNNYQSYSSGDKRNIINIKKNDFSLKILPLICYEIIYSGKIFNDPSFDIIINISEDGWFGQSIGPKQHFAHSIFRAVESGKYILRSANNGKAAIINPLGNVEQKVDYNVSGYIDFTEGREFEMTIFSKFGDKIFGFLILLYIFLIFSFNRMSNE